MPKKRPTTSPRLAVTTACAPSMVSVPVWPRSAAAASRSIAIFTEPATTRERTTSQRLARSSCPVVAVALSRCRSTDSAEWR